MSADHFWAIAHIAVGTVLLSEGPRMWVTDERHALQFPDRESCQRYITEKNVIQGLPVKLSTSILATRTVEYACI